jgi:hypothetical protein
MTGTPQGGVSCVCLIALDHLLGYRDRGEKGDSQEQKTTLSIRMPFRWLKERDLSRPSVMQQRIESQLKSCNVPPPENRKCVARKRKPKNAVQLASKL